jgi:hypothetical protein
MAALPEQQPMSAGTGNRSAWRSSNSASVWLRIGITGRGVENTSDPTREAPGTGPSRYGDQERDKQRRPGDQMVDERKYRKKVTLEDVAGPSGETFNLQALDINDEDNHGGETLPTYSEASGHWQRRGFHLRGGICSRRKWFMQFGPA